MNTRRLAVLALAAVVVLASGMLVRRWLATANRTPAGAPASEAAALQQLTEEGEFRRTSAFLAERVDAVAARVVYLSELEASGVRLRGDTVLSSSPARLVVVERAPPSSEPAPAIRAERAAPDSASRDWLLIVGRVPRGDVVWLAATSGGRVPARCAGAGLQEHLLDVPLSNGLLGAGVFGLDGRLRGLVVRCGDRPSAIPMSEVRRLLGSSPPLAGRMWETLGFEVAPLDSLARAYFRSDTGVLVSAIRPGGLAHRAAVRPGDVLLSVDSVRVRDTSDLADVSKGTGPVSRLTLVRDGRSIDARLDREPPPSTDASREPRSRGIGIGLESASEGEGITITTIVPGSPAQRSGLRAGDRLVRVGGSQVRAGPAADRVLASATLPTFVVFERDSVLRGVVVTP